MKIIQTILYERALDNYPQPVPYERLSRWYAFKLQKQIYYHNLTLRGVLKKYIARITRKIRNYLFVKIITGHEKIHWVHDGPGMYSIWNKPCRINCRYCKQETYIVHHVSYKFKPLIKREIK